MTLPNLSRKLFQASKFQAPLFQAPVKTSGAVLIFTVAGLALAACDRADAARPPLCRDAAITAALGDAAERLRAAEKESRRIAMGGNAFDAAKVGPVPGADLDAAMQRAAEEITAARRNLVAIRLHCTASREDHTPGEAGDVKLYLP